MNRRRGSVLILVLVIAFALTAMVLALAKQVRTSALAASNDVAAAKADAAARGAEQYVLSLLTDYRDTLNDLTETDFSAVPVGDAYFWIVRPDYGDSASYQTWGIVDEASKLSLNTATPEQMLGLAGVTDTIANSIVDWRDADDTASASGAESSTYSQYGYGAKNADFESVDELLLVNGMTHDLLYGPPPGQAPAETATSGSDWYLTHGLFDYFTAWNAQPDAAADGTARLPLRNVTQTQALRELFIEKGISNGRVDLIFGQGPGGLQDVKSVLGFAALRRMTSDEVALIEDYVTAAETSADDTTLRGKININTAPRDVLIASGMAEADVDTLLASRPGGIAQFPNSMAWLLDVFKSKPTVLNDMEDKYCARGRQYSADIVAASGNGRGFRHVRIVVDTTSTPPRIVYRRDLTDNGWPLDPQILTNLRSGAGVYGSAAAAAGSGTGTGAR